LLDNRMAPVAGLDMGYRLARCGHCGFHFADQLPPDAQYGAYYTAASKYDAVTKVPAIDLERAEAAVALLGELGVAKDSHIVDLGCGFGLLLAQLREAGWTRLSGIDPAPQSQTNADALFGPGLEIACASLADAASVIDLRAADLVCLMAVLEHLPRLRQDMAALLAQLRPGAQLLVEVPALDLFEPQAGEPLGELSMEHIQFFSAQSLRNFFASLGARVLGERLLHLPSLASGSVFVLAEFDGQVRALVPESPAPMDAYLEGSQARLAEALARVPEEPFVLYGAGSHSARLLPLLSDAQRARLRAVLDGNANLFGKGFGALSVQAPQALSDYPNLPVLISSFRAEAAIDRWIASEFPQQRRVRLYAPA
jgi:SAM-dependent methyltransferase